MLKACGIGNQPEAQYSRSVAEAADAACLEIDDLRALRLPECVDLFRVGNSNVQAAHSLDATIAIWGMRYTDSPSE